MNNHFQHCAATMFAGLAALTIGVTLWHSSPVQSGRFGDGPHVQTCAAAVCHNARCDLPDGTTVDVSSGTIVSFVYSSEARWADVVEGEAFFQVNPDPKRPFRVSSGMVVIEAVGTKFDVLRRHDHSSRAVVLEGHVRVERIARSTSLNKARSESDNAGQRDLYTHNEIEVEDSDAVLPGAERLHSNELERVLGWRLGSIEFRNESLSKVLGQLGPYYGVDFDLLDSSLRRRPFIGIARLGKLEEFLTNLRSLACVHDTRTTHSPNMPAIRLDRTGSCPAQ